MPRDWRIFVMGLSLAASVLMLGGKLFAYFITGSSAILSDAAESVIHGLATGFAAFSMWYSRRPASAEHPYGFGKIAYFSAGFEGSLILCAALAIYYQAGVALWRGPELQQLDWGLLITGGLAAVNLALGVSLVRVGRSHNDVILVANGMHVLTDMWTSVLVVAGVGLVWLTDIVWLDPVTAIFAASNIVYSAIGLMGRSFNGLLDQASPRRTELLLGRLRDAIDRGEVSGFHGLRHRSSHKQLWIELHMLLPGELPMSVAHERVTQVEKSLEALFPGYEVLITTHIEPSKHADAHPDGEPHLTAIDRKE